MLPATHSPHSSDLPRFVKLNDPKRVYPRIKAAAIIQMIRQLNCCRVAPAPDQQQDHGHPFRNIEDGDLQ